MPSKIKPFYFGIHAFYLEIMKAREISQETHVSKTRLLWWLSNLKDLDQGQSQQEPISICLKSALESKAINTKLLTRMIDYQLFEIDKVHIKTIKDLEIYGENTRSLLLYLNLHIMGITDDKIYKATSHLGNSLTRNVRWHS